MYNMLVYWQTVNPQL